MESFLIESEYCEAAMQALHQSIKAESLASPFATENPKQIGVCVQFGEIVGTESSQVDGPNFTSNRRIA